MASNQIPAFCFYRGPLYGGAFMEMGKKGEKPAIEILLDRYLYGKIQYLHKPNYQPMLFIPITLTLVVLLIASRRYQHR